MIFISSLIILFALTIFASFLIKTEKKDRVAFVGLALLFYIALIIFEQFYLETFYRMHFNLSDPTWYYETTKGVTFSQLLSLLASKYHSNEVYYVLNWIFQSGFGSPLVYGILIKITSAIFFLVSYLIFTWDSEKEIGLFDLLLLFNPWLLEVIIRNIRDFYVLFILTLFSFLSLKDKLKFADLFLMALAGICMYFFRGFFVPLMILILWIRIYQKMMPSQRRIFASLSLFLIISVFLLFKNEIMSKIVEVYLGNLVAFHKQTISQSQADALFSAFQGGSYRALVILMIKKILVSIPVFLFTPHPLNFFRKFISLRDPDGIYGLETDFDNVLIIAGALINYFFIFPIVFKSVHKIRQMDMRIMIIPIFIGLIYSFFLFGKSDIRIRYTVFFFLLVGFDRSGLKIYKNKSDMKYLAMSMAVMFIIPFL